MGCFGITLQQKHTTSSGDTELRGDIKSSGKSPIFKEGGGKSLIAERLKLKIENIATKDRGRARAGRSIFSQLKMGDFRNF